MIQKLPLLDIGLFSENSSVLLNFLGTGLQVEACLPTLQMEDMGRGSEGWRNGEGNRLRPAQKFCQHLLTRTRHGSYQFLRSKVILGLQPWNSLEEHFLEVGAVDDLG